MKIRFLLAPFNFELQQFDESTSWETVAIGSEYLGSQKSLSFEKDLESIAKGLYAFLAGNTDAYFHQHEVSAGDTSIVSEVYIAENDEERAWSNDKHVFLFIITPHWNMNSIIFRRISD